MLTSAQALGQTRGIPACQHLTLLLSGEVRLAQTGPKDAKKDWKRLDQSNMLFAIKMAWVAVMLKDWGTCEAVLQELRQRFDLITA